MRINRIQRYIIIMFCLWLPCNVLALGLGSMKTKSYLNQNLEAQIALIGLGDTALNSINAQLASPELFERTGVDYGPELSKLRFSVMRTDAGEPYVRVYSSQPIIHPSLMFLLQLTWPGGQLMRQYQAVLTPYVYSSEKSASTPTAVNSAETNKQYGLTKKEDNLWSVSTRTRPDKSISIPQMAIAIFLLNPEAFSDQSPQQLRQGVNLRLPTAAMAKQIPADAAKTLLEQHTLDPQALQKRYAFKTSHSSPHPLLNNPVSAKPVETTKYNVEPNKANHSQSNPSEILAHLTAAAPLKTELKLAKEALSASESKNQALQAQLANLQRQQSIVELANKEQLDRIKVLEEKLSAHENLPAETKVLAPAKETVLSQPPAAASNSVSTSPVEKPQTSSAGKRLSVEELPITMLKQNTASSEKDTWSPLSVLVWVVALIVLLTAIGYGLYVRWRNRHEEALLDREFAQSDQSEAALTAMKNSNIIFTKGDEGDDEISLPKEALSRVETDNHDDKEGLLQDPLQESDVYSAYGRFDQAEKVLLEALLQKPQYHACRVKLLELYAKQQDNVKFKKTLSQIPSVFLMQEPNLLEKVRQLENSFFEDSSREENDSLEDDPMRSDADNSVPTIDLNMESDEEEVSTADQDFLDPITTEENNNSLPFTAGLDLRSAEKQPDFQEDREVITTDVALKRAKQLLEKGDLLQAKMLLEEVSQKGDLAEQMEAKKLLQALP